MTRSMKWASAFDAAIFASGAPALFTLDPKGELRLDAERTREGWLLLTERNGSPPAGREEGHFLLIDHATKLKMYALVTHPALAMVQVHSDAIRFPDYASAVEEAMQQWAVPAP